MADFVTTRSEKIWHRWCWSNRVLSNHTHQSANEECYETMNVLAKRFNFSLEGAKPMKYSIAKSYEMTLNVLNNPLSYSKHTISIIYNLYPKYKYYTYNSKPSNYMALTNLNLYNRYLRIFVLNFFFF